MQFNDLIQQMQDTEQMPNLSVLEHGISVNEEYKKLIQELEFGQVSSDETGTLVQLYNLIKDDILGADITDRYQIYHDCGKPFCLIEENGKKHFPNHNTISRNIWLSIFPDEETIAELMYKDMNFHTMKADELELFWEDRLSATLFFTAYAEVLANCQMFGGQDSTSFKIKRKKLIQCAKQRIKKLNK